MRRILLCGFIIRTLLCGFHRANLLCGVFHTHSTRHITSSALHRAHSIECIPSIKGTLSSKCGYYREDSMMCIPSCTGYHMYSILCTPLYDSIVRQTEEGRGEGGRGLSIFAHGIHNCICVAVRINRDASTGMHQLGGY